jgi:hypothetical protein
MSASLLVALLAAVPATADVASPEIKTVDAQCKAAAKLDDARKEQYRVFADVSDAVLPAANDARGAWRELKTRDELKAFAQTGNAPNTQATIWAAPDGTRVAEVYFQSDTGDWSDDVQYCFRADGTLARLEATLSNYAADVEGRRITHFDGAGAVLLTSGKASSLETHKRVATMEGLSDPPIYPTVASLPFLAAKPAAAGAAKPKPSAPRPVLDQSRVADFVNLNMGPVRACYERERAKNAALAGTLVLHWTIGVSGATRNITVERDDLHDPRVMSCVQAVIAAWRFDATTSTTTDVSFPFVFRPVPQPPR